MKIYLYLWQYRAEFLEWAQSQTKVVEKVKTHILCSTFLFSKIVPFMRRSENMVQSDRPQMTMWRMRFYAATDIHSEYVTIIAFPQPQWLRKSASRLCYMCITWLVCYSSVVGYGCLSGAAVSNGWQLTEWRRIRKNRNTFFCPGALFLTVMSHIDNRGSGTVTAGWEESHNWSKVW
jgi:hypothetical protein